MAAPGTKLFWLCALLLFLGVASGTSLGFWVAGLCAVAMGAIFLRALAKVLGIFD